MNIILIWPANGSEGQFDLAGSMPKKAVYLDSQRPEAFNMLGGSTKPASIARRAHKYYRVALELDPTFEAASRNLERLTSRPYTQFGIVWDKPGKKDAKPNHEDIQDAPAG